VTCFAHAQQTMEAQRVKMEQREQSKHESSMPKRMKDRLTRLKQKSAMLSDKDAVKV
jgi:hypothetical protein